MGFVENLNRVASVLTIQGIEDILNAQENAGIATTKAAEALVSANNAHASDLVAATSALGIASHLVATSNPHSVTKAQIGLANVDNTTDLLKPISTATQTALTGKQPLDATLTALAGVVTTADKMIYSTASDTFATTALTVAARTLLDDADVATMRGTLGISATNTPSTAVGGIVATNVQAAIQELDSEKMATSEYLMAIGNINSPLLDMPLKNSLAMKAGVGSATFTRASTATYIDRYGVLKTAAIDEPRFEKEGYLNEGASTNLLTYSEDFSNASWAKGSVAIVADTTETLDPYGTNLAEKFSETAITSDHPIYKVYSFVAGTTYTQNLFVKVGTRTRIELNFQSTSFTTNQRVDFDLVAKTGTVMQGTPTYRIEELANGWFRLSITATATITSTSVTVFGLLNDLGAISYLGDITKYMYIFGAQLEALPFASSYIPTVASAVTRSADNLRVTATGNVGNGWEAKTIIVDSSVLGVKEDSRIFDLHNFNYNMMRYSANGTRVEGFYSSNGALALTIIKNKHRFTYQLLNDSKTANTVRLYVDGIFGGELQSQGCESVGSALTWIQLCSASGLSDNMYGHISNFRVYDKALSPAEVALC